MSVNKYDEKDSNINCIDFLLMPIGTGLKFLHNLGSKIIDDIKQTSKGTYDAIEEDTYLKMCKSVLTMDDCISWMNVQINNFSKAGYLFIYVDDNENPRNENDLLSVTLALLDSNKKVIYLNDNKPSIFSRNKSTCKEIVCSIVPTKTIDEKLLSALNGHESVLIKL